MACAGKPNICGGFTVANHKSALKRHKQSLQRAGRNRAARTRVKNAIKQVRAAIQNNEQGQASEALSSAASVLAKAAGKGAMMAPDSSSPLFFPTRFNGAGVGFQALKPGKGGYGLHILL